MTDNGMLSRLPIGPLASRPRLTGAILVMLLATVLLAVVPNPLRVTTRAILAWDAGCFWFIAASMLSMVGQGVDAIKLRAAQQDDGRHVILALAIIAAAASVGAIAVELSLAKGDTGVLKAFRVGLVFVTVAASWFVVQIFFAIHYAHQFYTIGKEGGRQLGGLKFPGEDNPDYWDFLHFSLVIGVASQTADICFTSRTLRRTGTVHSIVAFTFNTVVLALTINLLASLF